MLIFDETVTGFRFANSEAARQSEPQDALPDMTVLGGVLGGGLPLAAVGGRKDLMEHVGELRATGGTSAVGLQPSMAAGIATLQAIGEPGFYETLEARSARLEEGP